MTYFQIIKKHKNMIGGIAIALVILMFMPVFTTYAIDTMSDGKCKGGAVNYAVTTAETTGELEQYDSFEDMYDSVIGTTMVSDPVKQGNWTIVSGSGIYLKYNYDAGYGWYKKNGIVTPIMF